MTPALTYVNHLASASGGNTGQNHYGTIGIVIAAVVAVVIVVLWWIQKRRG